MISPDVFQFEPISDGFIHRCSPGANKPVAMCSRCVALDRDNLVASFMVHTDLMVNDFAPVLCRSQDGGQSWSDPERIWPHLESSFSISGSISQSSLDSKHLFYYGSRCPIDTPGEASFDPTRDAIKDNQLIWAESTDGGNHWTDPMVIERPIPGSSEAPGPICCLANGDLIGCYVPYNTFDPDVQVQRNQVMAMIRRHGDQSWTHARALDFKTPSDSGAESWVVQLTNRLVFAASWHFSYDQGVDRPNACAVSEDGGETWGPTCSTGIMGQSLALLPQAEGRVLMAYNQRNHERPGIGLALAQPSADGFGLLADTMIWRAERNTRADVVGNQSMSDFANFAFGEPSLTALTDGSVLLTFWSLQPQAEGIRYLHFQVNKSVERSSSDRSPSSEVLA